MRKLNIWFFAAFNFIYYVLLMLLYGGKIVTSNIDLPTVSTDWILLGAGLLFLVTSVFLPQSKLSLCVNALAAAGNGVYVGVKYFSTAIAFAKADAWFFTVFACSFVLSCAIAVVLCVIRLCATAKKPA